MSIVRSALVATTALVLPATPVMAADCDVSGAEALTVGTVAGVAAGAARAYTIALTGGEGVIVDLSGLEPRAQGEGEEGEAKAPATLKVCDALGKLIAPGPEEVFAKGGSRVETDDGERLRFVAPVSGQYVLAVAAADAPRELLVRRRPGGTARQPVIAASLGSTKQASVSSKALTVFSFTASAGQWVELKATSENDTLLRLAGPERDGTYVQLAENDDSDGLNPVIRRKLRLAGTYYLQLDSLSDDAASAEVSIKAIPAPKPAPPPTALRVGQQVAGRLADGDAVMLYSLPVTAGHSYRLDLTAPYDSAIAIGLPNPLEPEDGNDRPDAGFSEVQSQDANVTGTERLAFTVRNGGSLLVKVRCFGIGESDGGYSLTVTDLGE